MGGYRGIRIHGDGEIGGTEGIAPGIGWEWGKGEVGIFGDRAMGR